MGGCEHGPGDMDQAGKHEDAIIVAEAGVRGVQALHVAVVVAPEGAVVDVGRQAGALQGGRPQGSAQEVRRVGSLHGQGENEYLLRPGIVLLVPTTGKACAREGRAVGHQHGQPPRLRGRGGLQLGSAALEHGLLMQLHCWQVGVVSDARPVAGRSWRGARDARREAVQVRGGEAEVLDRAGQALRAPAGRPGVRSFHPSAVQGEGGVHVPGLLQVVLRLELAQAFGLAHQERLVVGP